MKKRSLTNGEIKLAKTIFGDSINYSLISVFNTKINQLQPDNFNAAPDGNLYMIKNYSDDFSKSPIEDQAALLHELTHIWQLQNNTMNLKAAFLREGLKHKFNLSAMSVYTLKEGQDFNEYSFEQQAGIIQDYKLLSSNKSVVYNQEANVRVEEYKDTLKKILANPSYARRPKTRGFFK